MIEKLKLEEMDSEHVDNYDHDDGDGDGGGV